MIWLLLALGANAQDSAFTPKGKDCGEYAVIAGTAGLRNAAEAIQTNASTYSASAFAGRYLARIPSGIESGEAYFQMVWDYNATFEASRLPVFHGQTIDPEAEVGACDPKWRVATRPYDLHATNIGFAVGSRHFTFMYASSFTYANPAYGDGLYRFFLGEFVAIPYAIALAELAPLADLLVPGPLDFSTTTSAFKLEYLAGATGSVATIDLAAAYLASKGAYFQVSESITGFYAFGAFTSRHPILQAGFDRVGVLKQAGMTSATYSDIPFLTRDPEEQEVVEEEDPSLLYRLRVGNLQQQSIAGIFDLGLRYRLAPQAEVSELALGIHNPNFHPSREAEDAMEGEPGGGLLLRSGFVTTPVAWAEGTGPARLLSLRAEGRIFQPGRSGGTASVVVLFNDPEQLQLYPFARNAVSYQLNIGGIL